MTAYFDIKRVSQLEEVMGSQAGALVASMLASLTAAVERLETAIAAGELEPVVQAAHTARNDALMLGAAPLQTALTDLETAARDADGARARAALVRLREVWPPTREELAGVARST